MAQSLKTIIANHLDKQYQSINDDVESELLSAIVKGGNPFMGKVSSPASMDAIVDIVTDIFDNEDDGLCQYLWVLDTGKSFTWNDFMDEIVEAYHEFYKVAYNDYIDKLPKPKARQQAEPEPEPTKEPTPAPVPESKSEPQSTPEPQTESEPMKEDKKPEEKPSSGLSKVIKLACIVYLVYLAKKFVKIEWFKQGYDKLIKFLNPQSAEKAEDGESNDEEESKEEEDKEEGNEEETETKEEESKE